MSKTPSRRVLWTLVATVAVVGGTIATSAVLEAREARRQNPPSDPSLPIDISRDPSLATTADQDGDALLDWEEALRGTNPRAADTDGDGTEDGAEVAAARDPKVRGPNDSVAEVASSTDAKLSAEYEAYRKPGTLTDEFAQNFASRYYDLKADGGFTANDQQSLLAALSASISGGGAKLSTTYRAELVPRMQDESAANLASYANAFAEAHAEALLPLANQAGTEAISASFGQNFRGLAAEICALPTPAAIAGSAAQVCNAHDTTGATVLLLARNDDPLASLMAVPSLQAAETSRASASQQIATYLAGRGVALQSGEYATFWTRMAEAQ
jgi:hypothetical protein